MKIRTKLFFSLAVPIVLVIALFGYLDQRRSRSRLGEELAREGRAIARAVQLSVEHALRDRQLEDVHQLVNRITGYERVLGVQIFDASGSVSYRPANLPEDLVIQTDVLRKVLSTREPAESRHPVGHDSAVGFLLPLSSPEGELLGAVEVLQLESFIHEEARASRNSVLALTGVMILAVGAILWAVTRLAVAGPVEQLVGSFGEVGLGDIRARVPIRRRDEFGRGQEFNRMCERLEAANRSFLEEHERRRRMEAQLRKTEQLAALGRMSAGLAHEIGTPLNVIGGRATALLRKLSGTEAERNLRIITGQIDRIARIVRGVLDFARPREPHRSRAGITAVVRKVLELLEQRFRERGLKLEASLPDGLPAIHADSDQLSQVFLNRGMNASDAMPQGGTLSIRCERSERPHAEQDDGPRPFLAVSFEDTGSGIASENLDRLFEPFFTTKELGKGTGLGLSVSYGIVQEHGGWIHVESKVGSGSRFTVYLPVSETPATVRTAAGENP